MRPWTTPLGPDDARVALQTSLEIFETLKSLREGSGAWTAALKAVAFAYAARQWPSRGFDAATAVELETVVSLLRIQDLPLHLYGGLAGVGWAFEHLTGSHIDPAEDATEEIEARLLAAICRWEGTYDLIGGLVGMGTYALERWPRGDSERCIVAILTRIEDLADIEGECSCWFTPPRWLTDDQLRHSANGYYDLGMAHGVSGIIAFLSAVASSTNASLQTRAFQLLRRAIEWLVSKADATGISAFPTVLYKNKPRSHSRLAWCYGDAGCLAALVSAVPLLDDKDLAPLCRQICSRSSSRTDLSGTGIVDAGLCHGTAGLAQSFSRVAQYLETPDAVLAAGYWTRQTLNGRSLGNGLSGYLSYQQASYASEPKWEADSSFLTGVMGIALTLLSVATEIEPNWDRILFAGAFGKRASLPER